MKRIVEAEAADDIDDSGPTTRTHGSLISCNGEDQLVGLGILYVILVSGNIINHRASGILFPYPLPFSLYLYSYRS